MQLNNFYFNILLWKWRSGVEKRHCTHYTSELSFVAILSEVLLLALEDDLLLFPNKPANLDVLKAGFKALDAWTLSSLLVVLPELAECIPLSSDPPLPRRIVPATNHFCV